MQQSGQAKVSLDAARLGVNSVFLIDLPGELLLGSPRPCPHRWVFDSNLICERTRPRPRPTLDQVQAFTRPLEVGLRAEVRHVDDEGVAPQVATRVAVPLANARRKMGTIVKHNVALPSLALTNVVEDRDAARGLHDATKTADTAAEFGQAEGQT